MKFSQLKTDNSTRSKLGHWGSDVGDQNGRRSVSNCSPLEAGSGFRRSSEFKHWHNLKGLSINIYIQKLGVPPNSAPKYRLRQLSGPYIQLVQVLLTSPGLLYMPDGPWCFLLALQMQKGCCNSQLFLLWGLLCHLCLITPGGLPIISYRVFIQKMKGEGCGKGGEREGKKSFLEKKRK